MSRAATIVADDYGIGRETSRAILELATEGRITATVLIVNTPDAERAARDWLRESPPADLGWHPNLTLDRPVSQPECIPTLVRADGSFWPMGHFLRRAFLLQVSADDARTELAAQYQRFVELVGTPPAVVNSHQHVSLLSPCDAALLDVLDSQSCRPYLRRVVERATSLARIDGDSAKRVCLSLFGRRAACRAAARGLTGCDWLVGLSNQRRDSGNSLTHLGRSGSVEIYCHPGYRDESLVGRDCQARDLARRLYELQVLRSPSFHEAICRTGLNPVRPSSLTSGGR